MNKKHTLQSLKAWEKILLSGAITADRELYQVKKNGRDSLSMREMAF